MKDITRIMAPALNVALPRANIPRTFPRAVLYGPTAVQGLGLTDPFIYQYCRHIQDIVDQPWRNTEVGFLIQTNLEEAKLEAGIYGSLFDSDVTVTWFNTTNSWIIETLEFCTTYHISFDEPSGSLEPNCVNDQSLMEAFASFEFNPSQLQLLNRCRLYCRVISLSDVTDGRGKHLILPSMTKPVQSTNLYNYKWPTQGIPPQRDWDFWIQALRSCFTYTGNALVKPLGLWLPQTQFKQWPAYIALGDLYRFESDDWYKYEPSPGPQNHRQTHYSKTGIRVFQPPLPRLRTRVVQYTKYMVATGTRAFLANNEANPFSDSIEHRFHQILQAYSDSKWICNWMEVPPNLYGLINRIQDGKGLGVSDGSYYPCWDSCSAGWILWTSTVEMRGGGYRTRSR